MKSLDHKLIIYDSNCKVCSSLRELVLKFTSISETKITAYKDLSHDLIGRVDANEFRNVMALIDTRGGKTLYGAEGIAYIFSAQYKVLDFLFRLPFVFRLFTFLYKTQAYNRYIIATPKSNFKCDCYPDRVVRYRISYILIVFLTSVLLTGLLGVSVSDLFGLPSVIGGILAVSFLGIAMTLQILFAILFMRRDALDYSGHFGSIVFVGLLIMIPSALFYFITGISIAYIPALSGLLGVGYMIHLHIHRVQFLERSQGWTLSWIMLLNVSIFSFVSLLLYLN